MPALIIEDVTDRPWEYSPNQWRHAHGIHIPHIAEISTMQYANMSKAARRRYDAKRGQEWEDSAAGWHAWKDAVLEAYDAGTIDRNTPGISDDARHIIIGAEIDRKKQSADDERERRAKEAQYTSVDDLTPGDDVFIHTLRQWVTVQRVNKKTVTVTHPLGNMKLPPQQLYRLDPSTL